MRLRNVRGSAEKILACPYAIQADGADASMYKGLWNRDVFQKEQPVHVEIGMGKGQFITQMAEAHPEIHYIGLEKYSSVLVRAIDKLERMGGLDNLRFVRMDAEDVEDFFAPGEVERIYLNFSDPWPKDRHAKRRLTSVNFLEKYRKFLKAEGELEFRTDNRPLFDFSLEQLKEDGWEAREVSFDLHASGPKEGHIMTEYEEKFYLRGNPICRFVASPQSVSAGTVNALMQAL